MSQSRSTTFGVHVLASSCFIVIISLIINLSFPSTMGLVQANVAASDMLEVPSGGQSLPSTNSGKYSRNQMFMKQSRRVDYSKPIKSLNNKKVGQKWTKKNDDASRRHRRALVTERPNDLMVNLMNKILKNLQEQKNTLDQIKNQTVQAISIKTSNKFTPKPSNTTKLIVTPKKVVVSKQLNSNKTLPKAHLESVLEIPGVKCGKVPVYEKLYHRSINESYEVDPDTGDFRILHGLDSVVGEWPWIVRIMECMDADSCSTCTGTLLNDRWVITAGHCAYNRSRPDKYTATFGLYDLVSPENSSYSVPIEKMIVHPDYRDLNNDLTLIKLAKPVKFSDNVRPACLVRSTRNVIDYARSKRCYNVGYGLTDGMEDAIKLQKLEIRVKQPSECNSANLGGTELKPGTVCIGPPPGKMGSSCKGDSGGPNLCYDPKEDSWHIIATVSYGPAVCDRENGENWLTVSVDLSNYRTWILSTILANS